MLVDVLVDSLLDTLKIFPCLLVTFLVLEWIEHKLAKKNIKILAKNKKYGVFIGGLLGAVPQCGFSVVSTDMYAKGIITRGTLIAIFLSTSDEMLPVMLGEGAPALDMLFIVLFKVFVGILIGLIVDMILRNKQSQGIDDICTDEHCHCKENGIIVSSLIHAFKTSVFILAANLIIGLIINLIGTDKLSSVLLTKNVLVYFLASLIGLIPNCAGSVILTEMYLSGFMTIGTLMAGLLTGCGLGALALIKNNRNWKDNLLIITIIYIVGISVGILVDLL